MKGKNKIKVLLVLIFTIVIVIAAISVIHNIHFSKNTGEVKIISSINQYGYTLKENKNDTFKNMFHELESILKKEKIDYDEYASKISEMFIYDFYSLDDKIAKNDVGGVQFIYPAIVNNFFENAESTYYKYVESNIYGNRNQELPMVDKVMIDSIEQTTYTADDITDEEAYKIKVSWDYTENEYSDYQTEATLILIHRDKILYIVELQ